MKYSTETLRLDTTYFESESNSTYAPNRTIGRLKQPSSTPLGKRCFDVVMASFVALTVLVWLVPVIGTLIKLSSPGPVFFIQWRTGRNGRRFRCLKFRTMRTGQVAPFKQASANDPRITKIGAFLRKTNLDEMPQFLNVLMGDMSIVGPRPHAVEHDAQYWSVVPNFPARYLVKPGITGLAQTRGLRGEAGLRDMEMRLKMDQWYIRKRSAVLDAKICWWTVEKMIKGDEKAY